MNKNAHIFAKLIRHDLSQGVLRCWWKYVFVIFIFAVPCGVLFLCTKNGIREGIVTSQASVTDYLIYILKGIRVYIPTPDTKFEVPILWLIVYVYLAFVAGSYPIDDLALSGQQILLRTQKRVQWWLGKCLWIVLNAIIFFAIGYAVIICFASVGGNLSLKPSNDIVRVYCEMDVSGVNTGSLLAAVTVLPLITAIALSLLQTTLAIILKPIYAFLLIACVMVASAYFFTWVLPGNHIMLLRNALMMDGGIPTPFSLAYMTVLALASIIVGCVVFRRYDILNKEPS